MDKSAKLEMYNIGKALLPPKVLWLEKIGKGAYLNMFPHPYGSQRAFFSNQQARLQLQMVLFMICDMSSVGEKKTRKTFIY
ncbi:hypothetical protein TorRG33x02_108830 [Trema orientale]|uniref:Uncharacterized protein n=1 Tax=Trema orientale TaxID=63057 RepID=A0A2P5F693_TREOI|nr:hypothetical protein TorRG33x02_108830 [Trema orientale]